jgi:hypothetical protein
VEEAAAEGDGMITKPAFYSADPLAYEIKPGVTVGDLKTKEECTVAIWGLERERDKILGQIATDEARPAMDRRPGWRTKAASALRWKKRIISAIHTHAGTLVPPRPPKSSSEVRANVILNIIRDEVGPREFERLIDLAKASRPDVFGRAE